MSGGNIGSFFYRVKHTLRPKISAKILIYFLLIALVHLMVVSYLLVTTANDQLLKNAATNQQAVATDLSRRVDNYLANNVNELALMARLYSTGNFAAKEVNPNFATLFSQSPNLKRIT